MEWSVSCAHAHRLSGGVSPKLGDSGTHLVGRLIIDLLKRRSSIDRLEILLVDPPAGKNVQTLKVEINSHSCFSNVIDTYSENKNRKRILRTPKIRH